MYKMHKNNKKYVLYLVKLSVMCFFVKFTIQSFIADIKAKKWWHQWLPEWLSKCLREAWLLKNNSDHCSKRQLYVWNKLQPVSEAKN